MILISYWYVSNLYHIAKHVWQYGYWFDLYIIMLVFNTDVYETGAKDAVMQYLLILKAYIISILGWSRTKVLPHVAVTVQAPCESITITITSGSYRLFLVASYV